MEQPDNMSGDDESSSALDHAETIEAGLPEDELLDTSSVESGSEGSDSPRLHCDNNECRHRFLTISTDNGEGEADGRVLPSQQQQQQQQAQVLQPGPDDTRGSPGRKKAIFAREPDLTQLIGQTVIVHVGQDTSIAVEDADIHAAYYATVIAVCSASALKIRFSDNQIRTVEIEHQNIELLPYPDEPWGRLCSSAGLLTHVLSKLTCAADILRASQVNKIFLEASKGDRVWRSVAEHSSLPLIAALHSRSTLSWKQLLIQQALADRHADTPTTPGTPAREDYLIGMTVQTVNRSGKPRQLLLSSLTELTPGITEQDNLALVDVTVSPSCRTVIAKKRFACRAFLLRKSDSKIFTLCTQAQSSDGWLQEEPETGMVFVTVAQTGLATPFQLVSVEMKLRFLFTSTVASGGQTLEGADIKIEPPGEGWHDQHTCISVEHLLSMLESPAMAHRWA